jgi:integrase
MNWKRPSRNSWADAVGEDYQTLVLFAAYTGLRAGEIAGLRVRTLIRFTDG